MYRIKGGRGAFIRGRFSILIEIHFVSNNRPLRWACDRGVLWGVYLVHYGKSKHYVLELGFLSAFKLQTTLFINDYCSIM